MLVRIRKIFLLIILMLLCYGCGEEQITKTFSVTWEAAEIYLNESVKIEIKTNMKYRVKNLTPEILNLKNEENDILEVEALKEGLGQIEIYADEEHQKIVDINVKNYPIPTSLKLKIKEEGPYYYGETYHLEYELEPANALRNFELNYNSNYMTINEETMEVTFNNAGEFSISCFSYDNMELEDKLEVDVLFNPDIEMYRLLFVGNSLTKHHYNIPYIVRDMIKADGIAVECDLCADGRQYLDEQTDVVESRLRKSRYTHVILQEQSNGSIRDYDRFERAVIELGEMIKENKAQLVLYQTWAYNLSIWNGMTKAEMQLKLIESYSKVAQKVGANVNRVGEAFEKYEARWGLIPSLYVDMNHPSIYGAYLSACVHYSSITGKKASDNTYIMFEIEYDVMKNIQEIADEVVFGN